MSVTGNKSYFEDFAMGMEFIHRRGRTVMQEENARWSLQTMNTAQSHWNIESMKTYLDGRFQNPIVNAAIVIALSAGLTSADITANMFADVGLDAIRITTPVFGGDTLTARSVVLELADVANPGHSGRMKYRIVAQNQTGTSVLTMERTVLIKRRSHWKARDDAFTRQYWPNAGADVAQGQQT
ncbi:MAG: MaoC family dehydratase [Xanthobacteraceae bacterium]|jgi:acyl dehydratase